LRKDLQQRSNFHRLAATIDDENSTSVKGYIMISSVNSGSMPPPPPRGEGATLTDEQTDTVNSILSSYDADNLTESDAQEIAEQLKEAGINPGKSLSSVMNDAGFDSKNIADLAGLGKPPPPPKEQTAQSLPDTATFSVTA
tara:strand:+ start:11 stop:433 length:423 start_codon:yes stop_codon:yes gene_type:complete